MASTRPNGGDVSLFGLGKRNQQSLSRAYKDSPIYDPKYLPALVADLQKVVLQGVEGDAHGTKNGVVNDNGKYFGTFDLNFTSAPNLLNVKSGKEGQPSTPFTPNLTSPGQGSMNAADQGKSPRPKSRPQYGSGLGSAVSPSTTSKAISAQTVGSLLSGKSYETSDGNS